MISRDCHARSSRTAPNTRHQFAVTTEFIHINQHVVKIVRLVHNHPSGDPTPSRADIDMTKMIIDTAKPLGITVHDHIIIGKDGHVSLKGLRLI